MKSGRRSFAGLAALFAFMLLLHAEGHAAEKDGGLVSYPATSGRAGPVLFSHRVHGQRGAGYACLQCHRSPSGGTMHVTMDAIRAGQACGACHDGRTSGPQRKAAAASVQDCAACHMPLRDSILPMNRMDPVAFSHVRHLNGSRNGNTSGREGLSCSDCHPALFDRTAKGPIGMEVPHESGGCAECHNGKQRSDGMPVAFPANTRCLTCHKFSE